KASLQQGYEKTFKFLILIGLPFGIFFSYFSKPFITLILGKAFVDATPVLQIFGWVLALMFLSNLMEKMLLVGGKQAYTMLATVISLCINLALDIILIPKMSYVGASFATLAAEIVMFVLTFYFVFKYVSYIPISKVALKPILASITTCVILFYIYQINIFLAVSCGILVYAIMLFLIKTFTQEEISLFRQLIGKRKPVLD
ncbi:MAG TPA: polysaccharide biosynthesis C-terminal domain-containing protein, partial [Candidatus Brocadiales bacterium]|nr:polysaccharide biosynthesis C-terminal domain-containing protein [Candidatus Brocadiales bacterium]